MGLTAPPSSASFPLSLRPFGAPVLALIAALTHRCSRSGSRRIEASTSSIVASSTSSSSDPGFPPASRLAVPLPSAGGEAGGAEALPPAGSPPRSSVVEVVPEPVPAPFPLPPPCGARTAGKPSVEGSPLLPCAAASRLGVPLAGGCPAPLPPVVGDGAGGGGGWCCGVEGAGWCSARGAGVVVVVVVAVAAAAFAAMAIAAR